MKLVKCDNCKYSDVCYLCGYDGVGLYKSGICKKASEIKLVDLHVIRHCESYQSNHNLFAMFTAKSLTIIRLGYLILLKGIKNLRGVI
jgi:hypothetical protein